MFGLLKFCINPFTKLSNKLLRPLRWLYIFNFGAQYPKGATVFPVTGIGYNRSVYSAEISSQAPVDHNLTIKSNRGSIEEKYRSNGQDPASKMFIKSRALSLIVRGLSTASNDIGSLVKHNKVVVFMKGVPEAPRCGFSNAVVQILRMHGVQYDAHDVLANEDIRQGVKDFSNWPTIPQVFMNGEFIGGCDILLQMHQNGELIEELKKIGITSAQTKSASET